MNENKITGQIVLRDVNKKADNTGRKLMMVIGIIAVPESRGLKGEHKYTIAEDQMEQLFQIIDPGLAKSGEIKLTVFKESEEDVSEETIGDSPTGIFRKPFWQV